MEDTTEKVFTIPQDVFIMLAGTCTRMSGGRWFLKEEHYLVFRSILQIEINRAYDNYNKHYERFKKSKARYDSDCCRQSESFIAALESMIEYIGNYFRENDIVHVLIDAINKYYEGKQDVTAIPG